MNWTGGSRNRVRRRTELQKQREYFKQRQLEQRDKPTSFAVGELMRAQSAQPVLDNPLKSHRGTTSMDIISLQYASYISRQPPPPTDDGIGTDGSKSLKINKFDFKRLLKSRDTTKVVKNPRNCTKPDTDYSVNRDWTMFLKLSSQSCDTPGKRNADEGVTTSNGSKRVAFSDTFQLRNYSPASSYHSEESPVAALSHDEALYEPQGNVSHSHEAKLGEEVPARACINGSSEVWSESSEYHVQGESQSAQCSTAIHKLRSVANEACPHKETSTPEQQCQAVNANGPDVKRVVKASLC